MKVARAALAANQTPSYATCYKRGQLDLRRTIGLAVGSDPSLRKGPFDLCGNVANMCAPHALCSLMDRVYERKIDPCVRTSPKNMYPTEEGSRPDKCTSTKQVSSTQSWISSTYLPTTQKHGCPVRRRRFSTFERMHHGRSYRGSCVQEPRRAEADEQGICVPAP